MIASGKKKSEEEANNLIRLKQEQCVELYTLVNPLLFWLDYSVEREDRFSTFKIIYSTLKDVMEGLPQRRVDIDIL